MRVVLAFAIGFLGCGTAYAQETTTYQYDALGRLTTSTVSGGPNNQTQTSITYDPAGNRTNYTVAGSANQGNGDPNAGSGTPSTQTLVIVVPLNGFTVIPIIQ